MIYLARLPRALCVALAILLGTVCFGALLALNAFYYALTSPSNREAFERIEAAADRLHQGRR